MRCARGLVLAVVLLELAACGTEKPRAREEDTPRADTDARDRRRLVSHLDALARERPATPAEIAALDGDRPAPALSSGASASASASSGPGLGTIGRFGGWRPRPPSLRMGASTVSGKLPREVVQRVVRSSFGRFRLCYEAALGFDKLLEGEVTPTFTIGGNGSPTLVSIASTARDADLEGCVGKAFSELQFPEPEDGLPVRVTFPVKFAPPAYRAFLGQSSFSALAVADVLKALADAGCTNVTDTGSVPGTDAVQITAKKDGHGVFVTFVPSTGAPVDPDDVTWMKRKGAVVRKDAFLVALMVDADPDRLVAKDLMEKLVPAP